MADTHHGTAFPEGFLWGGATAANQCEGRLERGRQGSLRGLSAADVFAFRDPQQRYERGGYPRQL